MKKRQSWTRRLSLEHLESRRLLAVQTVLNDSIVTFTGDRSDDVLFLRAGPNNFLEFSTDGARYSNDLNPIVRGNQALTLNAQVSIQIDLDAGDDRLFVESAVDKSGATSVYVGGTGIDELIAGDATNTWVISEPNRGTLNNQLTFSDVENLSGGDSLDQFQIQTDKPLDRHISGRGGGLAITGTSLLVTGEIIDSAEIVIAADERLVVTQDAVISTRQVERGADPRTAASTANSSDISLASPLITIDGNAAVLAHAAGRQQPGNVTIVANRANATRDSANSESSVLIDSATVTGGNITINAGSQVNAEHVTTSTQFGVAASLVAGKSSASVEIFGQSTVAGSGDVLVLAESTLTSQSTSKAAVSGNSAGDAAIALSNLESMAMARLGGRSQVSAAGNFQLVARSHVDAQTTADGDAGGTSAAGATLATTRLDNVTVASVEESASIDAKSTVILAQTIEDLSTTAVGTAQGATRNTDELRTNLEKYQATSASGDLGVASALSINDIDSVTQAFISTSNNIASEGGIDVRSLARNNHNSRADSTGVNSKLGGGAAVAVNLSDKRNESFLGGTPTLTSSNVSVATGMPVLPDRVSTFGAESYAGVGADSVGLAGAVSINVVNSQSQAFLAEDANAAITGNINFRAEDQSESVSASQPLDPSDRTPLFGIGSTLAINLVNAATVAQFEEDAGLVDGRHVSIQADSDHDVVTSSNAGAAGGVVFTPGVAITSAELHTVAQLGAGPTLTIRGNLSVDANHDGSVVTTAHGDAVADAVGLGTNSAINIAHHNAEATVAREVNAAGDITIATHANAESDALATAGQNGALDDTQRRDVSQDLEVWFAQVDTLVKNFGLTNGTPEPPTAQSLQGRVDVGAAIAVNVSDALSKARVTGENSVVSSGTLRLGSDGLVRSNAIADGSAVGPSTTVGVGTAVALNVATAANEAYVDEATRVVAENLVVRATLPSTNELVASEFAARATSGAGATSVAVVGSLAMNAVNNRTEAAIRKGASVQMTGSDIEIFSQNTSNSIAQAGSQADPEGIVGIGASVAVNLVDNETQAQLGESVGVANADQLNIKAIAAHAITTESDAGAAGAVATTPAVALQYGTSQTHVVLDSGPLLSLSGALNAETTHEVTSVTRASGLAAGAVVELGASLSIAAMRSVADVIARRDVNALGNIRLVTNAQTPSATSAVASVRGAEGEERGTASDGVNQRITDAITYVSDLARPLQIAAQVIRPPSAETDEGFVSVASAVAINVANTIAESSISDGVQLSTVRGLTISSSNNTDNTVTADGSPVATDARSQFGIGASVAINVSNSLNNATIGNGANVAAGTALVTAAPVDRDRQNRSVVDATSGAGATNLGVAGALAINVVNNQASAIVSADSSVTLSGGDLRILAQSNADNVSRSHPTSQSNVGLGASVAVNILGNGTYAEAQDNATIRGARDIILDATASHQTVADAQAGAEGGTAITPEVAVSYINNETKSRMGRGPVTILTGGLTVRTDHGSRVQNDASGQAVGRTAALGASVSVGVSNDNSQATLSRGVNVGRGIVVTSGSDTDSTSQAVASAVGAESDAPAEREGRVNRKIRELLEYGEGLVTQFGLFAQDADAPSAETEEGVVNAAAAVALNIALSNNLATLSTDQNVDAVGNVTVIASQATNAHAIADATAVGTDRTANRVGVGVAVGINVATPASHARIEDASVTANQIVVNATSDRGENRNAYTAMANSGAGGKQVGVAGALAINVAIPHTLASVSGKASLTTAGEIQITSGSFSESLATAIPRQVGEDPDDPLRGLGVGASVALNIVQQEGHANVENEARLNSARVVSMVVSADDNISTNSDAGSEGGTSLNPSVAIAYAGRNVEASLSNQSEVKVPGTLFLDADQRGTVRTVATGATAGLDAAVGASIAVGVLNEFVTARVDGRVDTGANTHVNSRAGGTTDAVAVSSARGGPPEDRDTPEDALDQKVDRLLGFASTAARAVGLTELVADVAPIEASEGPVSVAGALSVNVTLSQAQAIIAESATISSDGDTTINAVSGHRAQALADASSVVRDIPPEDDREEPISIGVGVAVAVNVPVITAAALADQKSVVRADGLVLKSVVSGGDDDNKLAGVFSAQAISGASSDDLGAVGALGLNVPIIAASSNIGSEATLTSGSLLLDARNNIDNGADAKANVGGELLLVGVGASAASNIVTSSAIAALAPAARVDVTGDTELLAQTDSRVRTTSNGGLNAGDGGVAGSVTFSLITETTTASIGEGAEVNQQTRNTGFDQIVDLIANSNTQVTSRSGVQTDATIVGVGAGADTGRLAKTTQALVAPSAQVTSTGDITLRATSGEDLTSVAATGSAGNSAKLAGAAAAFSLDITTLAIIGSQANVRTDGNIWLSADDDSHVDVIAGPGTDAKRLGSVGASVAAPVLSKRTEAYIDQLARVTAGAGGAGIEVPTGEFDIEFVDDSNTTGEISLPTLPSIPFVDTSFTQQRTAFPARTTISGLAITATSRDDIEILVVGAGLSGGLEVESSSAALVTSINTSAYVGNQAIVNGDRPLSENQTVHIAAGSDLYHLGIVGIATAAGLASVGPAVSLALFDLQTDAFVGSEAQVKASRDVHVAAHAVEDVLTLVVGFAGSLAVNAAGSLPLNAVTTRTRAFIDERAQVETDGNVLVEAFDHTESLLAAGSATLGLTVPGVNATLGITLLQKDTEAYVGNNAIVEALANRDHVAAIKDFTGNTERVKGVVVQALSGEAVLAATAGGSLGYFGGVAGAVTTTIIDSDTSALIDRDARVNTNSDLESTDQSVYVTAVNDSHATTIAGGLVRTAGAGLPGAVDLGIVRNDTTASILSGAIVNARRDVDVRALASQTVGSLALSAKGGGIGVAGSIGILSIGTMLDQESRRFLVPLDDSDTEDPAFGTVNLFVDAQLSHLSDLVESLLTSYADSDLAGSIFRLAGESVDNNTPDSPVTTYVDSTDRPTGTVAIIDGATVNAGRHVGIHADQSQTSNMISGAGAIGGGSIAAGAAVANVDSRPQVYLEGNARVTAGDNFEMQSRAIHALDASGYVPTVGGLASVGYTSTIAGSHAVANVGGRASVDARSAVVTAENRNSFFTGSKSFGFQTSGLAGVGATITVSNYDSSATSRVLGNITTSADTTIDATSTNETNATRGSASIKDPFENKLFGGIVIVARLFSDEVAGLLLNFRPGGVAFTGGAAVVLANSSNTATAAVGAGGIISAGANLDVTSSAIDNFRVSSTASAGNADVGSVGGALAVTNTSNEANAVVESGAEIDVLETTLIQANATVPNQIDIFGFELDLDDEDEADGLFRISEEFADMGLAAIDWETVLAGLELLFFTDSALADGVANTLVHSGASLRDDGIVGVAGGVNILEVNNTANARIEPSAKVNLKTEGASGRQTVTVDSNARIETINMAGQVSAFNLSALGAGAENAAAATGGSFDRITYHNIANSWIDDGAEVVAVGDVNVTADTFDFLLILGQAGADADRFGVGGTIGLAEINDTTRAWIEDEAKISSDNDVNVIAESDITTFTGSGGLTIGGNLGIGISASINDIYSSTEAFIGDTNQSQGELGFANAQKNVNVTARSDQKNWTVALAGTFSSGESFGTGGEKASNGLSFGFGVSGDVALNHVVDNTLAYILERARVDADNALNVKADSSTFTATGAGGMGFGQHVGIAGSFGHAIVDKTVHAFVQNADVSATSVSIDADSDDFALTISAGGTGLNDKIGLGGSVNQNEIQNDVQAFLISETARRFAGDVSITADNRSVVMSIAGGLALGGHVPIGTTLDLDNFNNSVHAYLRGEVSVGGELDINANNGNGLRTLGAALAASDDKGIGASGSLAIAQSDSDVQAYVAADAQVTADGSVYITADDTNDFVVLAGNGAGSSSVGAGASSAVVSVDRTVQAYLDERSRVSARGLSGQARRATGLVVNASSRDNIVNFAAGVAVAEKAAANASVVQTTLRGATEAFFDTNTSVNPDRVEQTNRSNVQVQAHYGGRVFTVGGAFAGSETAGAGAALATNDRAVSVRTFVEGADVQGHDVEVLSGSDAHLTALTVGGSGAEKIAAGGAVSLNTVADTIVSSVSRDAAVHAVETMTVAASDRTGIFSLSGGVAGAGKASVGASLATNTLSSAVRALVDNAEISTGTATSVSATSDSVIDAITVGGAFSETLSIAGSVSLNTIDNVIDAHVSGGTSLNSSGTVQVEAEDDAQVRALAGSVAGAGTGAVGASVATNTIGDFTTAFIEGADVSASDELQLLASSSAIIASATAGGAGAEKFAGGGAISVNNISNINEARVVKGATLHGGTEVRVTSRDRAAINSLAGAVVGAGAATLGLATATNSIVNSSAGFIEDAAVNSSGSITVATQGNSVINTTAAGGGGAGKAAVHGSLALNHIESALDAHLDQNAVLAAADDVKVTVLDDSTIIGLAGSVGGAGFGSVNASAATNQIANDLTANVLDAQVTTSGGTVLVSTTTDDTITTMAAGVGGAGKVSLTGGVSLNTIDNTLIARLAPLAAIQGAKDVSVLATDLSNIQSLSGQAGGALTVGIGTAASYNEIENTIHAIVDSTPLTVTGDLAVESRSDAAIQTLSAGGNGAIIAGAGSVSVNVMENDVQAYVTDAAISASDNMSVLAELDDSSQAYGGTIGIGGIGVGGSSVTNLLDNNTLAYIKNSNVSVRGEGAGRSIKNWAGSNVAEKPETVRGLSVIASSREDLDVIAVTGTASLVGVGANVIFNRVNDSSEAFIDNSAINNDRDRGQAVIVRAHQATDIGSNGGTIGGSVSGFGLADDTSLITNTTRAYMADSDTGEREKVFADDLEIATFTFENIQSITGTGGVATAVQAMGAVAVMDIASTSDAYLREVDGVFSGSLTVKATDRADAHATTGGLSGGIAAGTGGALAVGYIANTTRARIAGSETDVRGDTLVEANSTEFIQDLVGFTGVGGASGVAGTVAVSFIGSTTEATIDAASRNSSINQDASQRNDNQDVVVRAIDSASIVSGVGTAGGSIILGMAGSLDVPTIRNIVNATIGENVPVHAGGNVEVVAIADRNINSKVVAVGGGAGGLTGALSIAAIGGGLNDEGAAQIDNQLRQTLNEEISLSQGVPNLNVDFALAREVWERTKLDRFTIDVQLFTEAPSADTLAHIGPNASVIAGDELVVRSLSDSLLDVTAGGAALNVVGVGGAAGLASIDSNTVASVGSGVTVEAGQRVSISADANVNSTNVRTDAGNGGGVGVGASVSKLDSDNDALAFIAHGAVITKAGVVDINANSFSTLHAVSTGGSAGGAVVGAVVASGKETGSTQAYVDRGVRIGEPLDELDRFGPAVGDLRVDALSRNHITSEATAGVVGVLAGAGADADARSDGVVRAYVGDETEVHVGQDVRVTSTSEASVDADAAGVTVAVGALGGSVADAFVSTDVDAFFGNDAQVNAGGDVLLRGMHNYEVVEGQDGRVTATALDRRATATSSASGGGVPTGLGALANGHSLATTDAYLQTGSQVIAGDDLTVQALAHNEGQAQADGITISVVGAGATVADAQSRGATQAYLSENANVSVGGDLSVEVITDDGADAEANVSSGGIVSGRGAEAKATSTPANRATIAGNVIADVGRDGRVSVDSKQSAEAEALGNTFVGFGFGASVAEAIADGTSQAYVDAANLAAGRHWSVETTTASNSLAEVTGANAGLVEGTDNEATARVDSTAAAFAESNSTIHADGNVTILSRATNDSDAKADSRSLGAVELNATNTDATILNRNQAYTGNNAVIDAGGDLTISTQSDNRIVRSEAIGAESGLLGNAVTSATSSVDDRTTTTVGDANNLTARGTAQIDALSGNEAHSDADTTTLDIIAINTTVAETVAKVSVQVDVGTDSNVAGDEAKIHAKITKLDIDAQTHSKTTAADSSSVARSSVDLESDTDIQVRPGATITGCKLLEILTLQENVDIDSDAQAEIQAGLTGVVEAEAYGNVDLDSDIVVQSGATLVTDDLVIEASAPGPEVYSRTAEADAETVVNVVEETVTETKQAVTWIPGVGAVIDWLVCETTELVTEVLHSDESAVVTGTFSSDNSITLDGDVLPCPQEEPTLFIAEDGTITTRVGIDVIPRGDQFILGPIVNDSANRVQISAPGGPVRGNGTIALRKALSNVTIVNNSTNDLIVQDIQSRFVNEGLPDIQITTGHDETNFSFASALERSQITIRNNSTGNVILRGPLTNPIGSIQIANERGDIVGGDGHRLLANQVFLEAANGAIGNATAFVTVELVQDTLDAELDIQAGADAWLDTSVLEFLDQPPTDEVILARVDLSNLRAGGDIRLRQSGARILVPSAEPGVPARAIDVAALPTLSNVTARSLRLSGPVRTAGQLELPVNSLGDAVEIEGILEIGAGTALEVTALTGLDSVGDHVVNVINAEQIIGLFALAPQVGQHLGSGTFVRALDELGATLQYGGDSVAIGLFQAAAGDTDGDRQFSQVDVVRFLQSAKYLTGEEADWLQGDWTGDGLFDQRDIVAALATGNYLQGRYGATNSDLPVRDVNEAFDHVFRDFGNS